MLPNVISSNRNRHAIYLSNLCNITCFLQFHFVKSRNVSIRLLRNKFAKTEAMRRRVLRLRRMLVRRPQQANQLGPRKPSPRLKLSVLARRHRYRRHQNPTSTSTASRRTHRKRLSFTFEFLAPRRSCDPGSKSVPRRCRLLVCSLSL